MIVVLAFAILAFAPAVAQSQEDRFDQLDREFDEFVAGMELEQRAFLAETDAEYRRFVAEVERQWGEFVPSTRPRWSSYSANLQAHGEADFEQGTVVVEILADPAAAASEEHVVERLSEQLETMMSDRNPSKRNVLADQVDRGDGTPATPEDTTEVVKARVAAGRVSRRAAPKPEGGSKIVVGIELPMVPDRLSRAAKPYMALVRRYAERYRLDADLVLAVTHTESWFNPLARSPIPAFGLMQLVPRSGALDAYEFVYGEKRVVDAAYLYDPERNLELGCAYLHLLINRYMAMLKSDSARILAAIAAYNCGPGNTRKALRTLHPDREIPTTASLEQVRAALLSHTPMETRNYVRKVSERRVLWRGGG